MIKLSAPQIFKKIGAHAASLYSNKTSRRIHLLVVVVAIGILGTYFLTAGNATTTTALLKPTSDASATGVEGMNNGTPTSTGLSELVDDGTDFSVADDDATYIQTLPGASDGSYTTGFSGAPAGTVSQAAVNIRAKRTKFGNGTVQAYLYDGSNLIGTGAPHMVTGNYADFTDTFSGLTVADANNLHVQVMLHNNSKRGTIAYTQEWLAVTYPAPTNNPPTVSISQPISGASVSGSVVVSGTANDDGSLATVEAQVDGGSFQPVTGMNSWVYNWDTAGLSGSHTITVKATDNTGLTATMSVTVNVTSPVNEPSSAPFLKVFSAEEETSNPTTPLTSAIAEQQAKGLDLIIANSTTYKNYVTALKSGNPSIKLWCYLNATEAQKGQGPASGIYPTAWYAKQANGYYLRNKTFGNWLMDPSNSAWANSRLQAAQSCITNNGYDSIFWDVLGPGPVAWNLYNPVRADGTVVSGVSASPLDIATNQPWTRLTWLQTTGGFVASSQSTLGHPLGGNGLVNGQEYYNTNGPTSTLFGAAANNIMAENFLRSASQAASSYPTETVWKQNVNMLVDAGQRSKTVFAYTKVWTSDTQAAKDAVHKYALASFMLGTDGNSYFSFRYDKDRVMGNSWWDKVKTIGTPLGSYYKTTNSALYERDFTNGKVFVDPTGTVTSVNLSGTYTTLSGTAVSSLGFDSANRAEIVFGP